MTFVTLQALEGIERGNIYAKLPLPVTIGRESDCDVQLNDDRVSRAHAKLQDHAGKVILTDLASTNGTRVNGHPIQMRVMQHGDIMLIGRCVLRFSQADDEPMTDLDIEHKTTTERPDELDDLEVEYTGADPSIGCDPGVLFPQGRPVVPAELTTLQRVQLSDLLSYVHEQLGVIIRGAVEDIHGPDGKSVRVDWPTWTRLSSLQSDVSRDIRAINNPES